MALSFFSQVAAVQCLQGARVWEAGRGGRFSPELVLAACSASSGAPTRLEELEAAPAGGGRVIQAPHGIVRIVNSRIDTSPRLGLAMGRKVIQTPLSVLCLGNHE